ncbi:MAG: NAD(P)-dependent oxidoreductase [Thermoleophilaceae bacterium]
MVTGAGGMLGRDVVRAAEAAHHDVVGANRAVDVTDRDAVRRAVAAAEPDVVFNCAAWTDVDGAEEAEEEATRVNGEAAGIVAAGAAGGGAGGGGASTDYVFDGRGAGVEGDAAGSGATGERGGGRRGLLGRRRTRSRKPTPRPYVESDPVGPLSAYGRSKLAGEEATSAANPRHFVVRTSWLFGTGGRNFVETMLGLAETGQVTVVRDQVGSPTYTGHLAEGLLRLAATEAYGVHHMTAGGHCSWYDFARAIFAAAEVDCQVLSATTDVFPRPAPRPPWSVLDTEWPDAIYLPDWPDGLRAYLAERSAKMAA